MYQRCPDYANKVEHYYSAQVKGKLTYKKKLSSCDALTKTFNAV
jgi:hypothetical protein